METVCGIVLIMMMLTNVDIVQSDNEVKMKSLECERDVKMKMIDAGYVVIDRDSYLAEFVGK